MLHKYADIFVSYKVISRGMELTRKKYRKQHFSWDFLHEIRHICRIEGALSNDSKIIQTEYCFQGHTQGQKENSNNDHEVDLGDELESNVQLERFRRRFIKLIRFYNCPKFHAKRPTRSVVF